MAVATSEHISFCFSTVKAICPSNGVGTTYFDFTGDLQIF